MCVCHADAVLRVLIHVDVDVDVPPIAGVNLGGWLVLEPWIKPSLFAQFHPRDEVVDQWRFCEVLGKKEAAQQLELHYQMWLTEKDVAGEERGMHVSCIIHDT